MSRTRSSELVKILAAPEELEKLEDNQDVFEIPQYSYVEVPSQPVVPTRKSILLQHGSLSKLRGVLNDNVLFQAAPNQSKLTTDEEKELREQLEKFKQKEAQEEEEKRLKSELDDQQRRKKEVRTIIQKDMRD